MKTTSTNQITVKKAVLWITFLLIGILSYKANAQSTSPDSVCAGSQDVIYGIMNSNPTSTYSWSLSDPTAGTIDTTITPNDSIIQIDWGSTTGTYTLYLVETNINGCLGDTVGLDITINALPTIALIGDSVCTDNVSQITASLTGEAPWIIDYTDGSVNYTDTAIASPYVINLPAYASTQTISITGVIDGNTCAADASGLPSTTIFIYPKPATASIYHY